MAEVRKIFLLINKVCEVHCSSIVGNWQNEIINGQEDTSKNLIGGRKLAQYWKNITANKLSLEEFNQGIKIIDETKTKLWKTTRGVLWVKNFDVDYKDTLVPNVYDVLKLIFYHTTSTDRLKYFHELTRYYYKNLKEGLEKEGLDLEDVLSTSDYAESIEKFLPCVKLDLVMFFLQNFNESQKEVVINLIDELTEFILCPNLLREDCFKIIEKLHCTECESLTFELKEIKEQFGNLGCYGNLKLNVHYGNESKECNFFTKSAPEDNETVKALAVMSAKKEEFFYNTFIPQLEAVGLGELIDFAPEVFFVRRNGILVLEDLKIKGYKEYDIRDPSNFEVIAVGLKKIAKLHAASLLFEEHKSKMSGRSYRIDEEFGEFFQETLVFRENAMIEYSAKYICDYFPHQFQEILKGMSLEYFQNEIRKMHILIDEKVKKSPKFRNVLSHGDLWYGNMLFNDDVQELSCFLVDYQLIRYAPPLLDVLMLIYINTDKQFRDIHKENLLSIYRETLRQILDRFGVDINDIYDEDTFNKCVEDMTDVSLVLGVLYNKSHTLPKEIAPFRSGDGNIKMDFVFGDRHEIYQIALKDDIFYKRMKGLIEDLYELCERNK